MRGRAAESCSIDTPRWVRSVRGLGLAPAVHHGLKYALAHQAGNIPTGAIEALSPRDARERKSARYFEENVSETPRPVIDPRRAWAAFPGSRGKARLLRKKFLPSPMEAELRFGVKNPLRYAAILLSGPFRVLGNLLR